MQQEPQAPAVAYHSMARLLGEGFFLTPPSPRGARLEVIGVDSIITSWDMTAERAQTLIEPLRIDPNIVRVIPRPF